MQHHRIRPNEIIHYQQPLAGASLNVVNQTAISSVQNECKQAGTEQDEAGSGECEETGRREVIVAHDMPP